MNVTLLELIFHNTYSAVVTHGMFTYIQDYMLRVKSKRDGIKGQGLWDD